MDVFANACSTFLYLDDEEEKPTKKPKASELRGDGKLMNLIRDGIASAEDDDGWASLSRVGSHISNQASFDPRNYGYARLSDLIEALGLFELRRNASRYYEVRNKQKR